jgi:hypothetical protein
MHPAITHPHFPGCFPLREASLLGPLQPIQFICARLGTSRFVPSFSLTAVKRNFLLGSKAELFTWPRQPSSVNLTARQQCDISRSCSEVPADNGG